MKGWRLDQRTYARRLVKQAAWAYEQLSIVVPGFNSGDRQLKFKEFQATCDPRLLLDILPAYTVVEVLVFYPRKGSVFAITTPAQRFAFEAVKAATERMAPVCANRAAELLGFKGPGEGVLNRREEPGKHLQTEQASGALRVAIVDADLLDKRRHRFPNLAAMKLSAWHKATSASVKLILDWKEVLDGDFEKVYVSKVFTATTMPEGWQDIPNMTYGGTGFYMDKANAPKLPDEVEHFMPDYHLYDEWVENERQRVYKVWVAKSKIRERRQKCQGLIHQFKESTFLSDKERTKSRTKLLKQIARIRRRPTVDEALKYYTHASIGFTTRGCIRKCQFCVNKNESEVKLHSTVEEFVDHSRPYISLWDDNILAFPGWRSVIDELKATGKPFEFKQGMDLRLLTPEKAKALGEARYHGDYLFAFDNIADKELIVRQLETVWAPYISQSGHKTRMYVLVGFDRQGKYGEAFYRQDMMDAFERARILLAHGCYPYIMCYADAKKSPYGWFYMTLAAWCNQMITITKMTFAEVHKQRGVSKKHPERQQAFERLMAEDWFRSGARMRMPDFLVTSQTAVKLRIATPAVQGKTEAAATVLARQGHVINFSGFVCGSSTLKFVDVYGNAGSRKAG